MKKIVIIFCLMLIGSSTCFANSIVDIEGHWAQKEIERFLNNGWMVGYPDHTFQSERLIQKNEWIKMLVLASGVKIIPTKGEWYQSYWNTAIGQGWIDEKETGDYEMTRMEAAQILKRFLDLNEQEIKIPFLKDLLDEQKLEIGSLIQLGIIKGYPDQTFRGEEKITRAEAVLILNRALNEREKKKEFVSLAPQYTNISQENDSYEFENIYQIEKDKILYTDTGKYGVFERYIPREESISNQKIIEMIKVLINEGNYVYSAYIPGDSMGRILITYGEREGYIKQGAYFFQYIIREKNLENRKQQESNPLLEINIQRLWKERNDFLHQQYIDSFYKEKLQNSLEIMFNPVIAKKMVTMIEEIYLEKMENTKLDKTRTKTLGNYRIEIQTEQNKIKVSVY